ncbi:beta-ketoacyl-[acyl-carrier-protein] synthase family protein [Pseudomaricurvus sp.]|uniref:beta-ketoacyl-[acyl-carrier-protein] synthase family protein n=1 Tax=Pseudomaricurvus sp. TaxID=2004510 RepID=UPI003F6A74DB
MNQPPVYLNHLGLICAMGSSPEIVRQKLFETSKRCLSTTDHFTPGRPLPLGMVNDPLPDLSAYPLIERTRTNQLMAAALEQIQPALEEAKKGIDPLRIGIVLGTSTSGIAEGETAISDYQQHAELPATFDYQQQEMANPATTLARWLGTEGPAYVVSTACSSGAKALASARRLLRMGVCDLVIAGGVDSLCKLTVNGFSALESVSKQPCNPFSRTRNGINIGEGAALFIVSRDSGPVQLSGVGEGSDAHHISAPDPEGLGAERVMTTALANAGLTAGEIGYLNLHGTATLQNDKMESLAVERVLGSNTPCSSTKSHTGHTLGAAGAIEAAFCWLALTDVEGRIPLHAWDSEHDDELANIRLVDTPFKHTLTAAMSNSFAFGGNNISLVLERTS